MAFFTQNKAQFCKILIITLVFEKNATFSCTCALLGTHTHTLSLSLSLSRARARARAIFIFVHFFQTIFTYVQFYKQFYNSTIVDCCNFTIFKLRSSTEQMPSLV
jgi:hypothetical protein